MYFYNLLICVTYRINKYICYERITEFKLYGTYMKLNDNCVVVIYTDIYGRVCESNSILCIAP